MPRLQELPFKVSLNLMNNNNVIWIFKKIKIIKISLKTNQNKLFLHKPKQKIS
jgi:hypothetical protein